MDKRILVVTSCTGEKLYKPENQLVINDFLDDERRKNREEELADFKEEAGKMYTGSQHLALMRGVKEYRNAGGHIEVDILSAGYGLIRESDMIVPYEVTFNSMNSVGIKRWSRHQKITETLTERIKAFDLVFFLLGDRYLQAIEWPLSLVNDQKFIFFAGESSKARVLIEDGYYVFGVGEKEAKRLRFGLIGIKGFLFSQLLRIVMNNTSEIWNSIYQKPELVRNYILSSIKIHGQIELFPNEEEHLLNFFSELYPVPPQLISNNYQTEFRFFMPENDDRVNPKYNFQTDESEKKRNPLLNDVYAHEIYGTPQYDGILISKVNMDNASQQKNNLIKEIGIRKFLRLPENYPIIGDCGAFSYINQELPPYSTKDVIRYYEDLGFDYGVSVDHLIVGPYQNDEVERDRRYELTLSLAEDFIRQHEQFNCTFKPIGVVQGWDPSSFRNAVEHMIRIGYQRVALGGLAREQSGKIYEILKEISPIIPNENFRLHLFGVARDMRTMKAFHKLGVTSFDSASPLRRAWLGSGHNFHTSSGKHFTAIRIPEVNESTGRVKKLVAEGKGDFPQYRKLEQEALTALRKYEEQKIDLDQALSAILKYDELLGEKREAHEELYRELLLQRPWEECACTICNDVGVDVIIFRGNNRNRRRGFHNTYAYYSQVKKLREEIFSESHPVLK
jgi:hypothetical protein